MRTFSVNFPTVGWLCPTGNGGVQPTHYTTNMALPDMLRIIAHSQIRTDVLSWLHAYTFVRDCCDMVSLRHGAWLVSRCDGEKTRESVAWIWVGTSILQ